MAIVTQAKTNSVGFLVSEFCYDILLTPFLEGQERIRRCWTGKGTFDSPLPGVERLRLFVIGFFYIAIPILNIIACIAIRHFGNKDFFYTIPYARQQQRLVEEFRKPLANLLNDVEETVANTPAQQKAKFDSHVAAALFEIPLDKEADSIAVWTNRTEPTTPESWTQHWSCETFKDRYRIICNTHAPNAPSHRTTVAIYDKDYETIQYCFKYDDLKANAEISRVGNILRLRGSHNDENRDKDFLLNEGDVWIQEPEGVRNFIQSSKTTLRFVAVLPENLQDISSPPALYRFTMKKTGQWRNGTIETSATLDISTDNGLIQSIGARWAVDIKAYYRMNGHLNRADYKIDGRKGSWVPSTDAPIPEPAREKIPLGISLPKETNATPKPLDLHSSNLDLKHSKKP